MKCLYCGAENPSDAVLCMNCGHTFLQREVSGAQQDVDYVQSSYDDSYEYSPYIRSDTILPVVGGALMIAAGLIGIFTMILVNSIASVVGIAGYLSGICLLVTLGNLLNMLGGWFAISRSHFVLVLLFAIVGLAAGIFSIYFLSFIITLIGLVLIAVAHSEFQ